MNIKGWKARLERKKQSLAEELAKEKKDQNQYKIRRLEESIKRNKNIGRCINRKRRRLKQKQKKKK